MTIQKTPTIYKAPFIYKQGGSGDFPEVEIFGTKYHFTLIGNLYWTCENLSYNDELFTHDTSYQNDRTIKRCLLYANFENAGYLYSDAAAYYIKTILNNGWRLPTYQDINKLKDTINSESRYLIPNDSKTWQDLQYIPKNIFNFSALACGQWDFGNFKYINERCFFIGDVTGITGNDTSRFYQIYNSNNNLNIGSGTPSPGRCYNIRLCKDALDV